MTVQSQPRGAFPADRLAADLRERARVFELAAARTQRRSDGEAIHDLRVSARRLNAALSLWRDLLRDKPRRDVNRCIRRLRRALGPAREFEVHHSQLLEFLRDAPKVVQLAAAPVVDRLERRVERTARTAQKQASSRRIERMLNRMHRALPDVDPARRQTGNPLAAAEETLQRCARRANVAIRASLATGEDVPLHQARIAVKKWRYTLECIRAVEPDYPQSPQHLRDLQRALGVVHDVATLREFIMHEARRLERKARPDDARALQPIIDALAARRIAAVAAFAAIAATLRLESA